MTLGDVITLKSGDNLKVRDCDSSAEYPIYGGNGINGTFNKFNVECNTIIIGRVGFYCGSVNITTTKAWVTDNALIVSYLNVFDAHFLLYLLRYLDLGKTSNSTAQPVVSGKGILPLFVPIPPIEEQKRIVAEIERAYKLVDVIDKDKNAIESTISKVKSKILDLAIQGKLVPQDPTDESAIELLKRINPDFKPCDNSHYGDLPIGWSICTLYDICDTINGLWKGKNPPFVNVGVIRNANFTKDFNLDYSKIEYIDVEQRAFEKRNLEDGDLIVEKSGGSDNFPVGRSILYQGESSKYSFSNFTMALRIKDKNLICSKYLYFVILHKYLSGEMTQMQTQTTGLHNLLSDKYMSMPIPMPPTKEQDRIVECIEKLLGQANQIKTVL